MNFICLFMMNYQLLTRKKVQMENRWLLPIEVLKKIDPMGLQTLQTGCRYILTVKISIMLKRHRLVSSQKRLIALNSNP